MSENLQQFKQDDFNIVFTKTVERATFAKELEQIYDKHYKANYEQDGFRMGEVPFELASKNAQMSTSLLKTVALVDRQILVEEIIKEVSELGSIYDIKDGELQTSFEGLDLSSPEPIIFQLTVELASFVDSVDYEKVAVDKDIIKTKPASKKDLTALFKEYKKVKQPQNKATKTSYVALTFFDGKDTEELTFNLQQKFKDGDEPLKITTHKEITELVIGKKVGDEFDYSLKGKDGKTLDVHATIVEVYKIKNLSDDDFIEMLKETGSVPEEQKADLDIEKVKVMFNGHIDSVYNDNFQEEVRSLTFASLNSLTEGIHYNETEINNLKNQFTVQVQKAAAEEGIPFPEYVSKNFGSQKMMEDYADASNRARVLQAAIYRKIGKDMGVQPTYQQLEAFVRIFLFKIKPGDPVDEGLAAQINEQTTTVLSEPLNRQRVIESWASVKAEDTINNLVGLLK